MVKVIINRPLSTTIYFHVVPHGLQVGRSTGTDSLKAKLLQELTTMREEVLYAIFLELHKVYDALDREI